MAKGCDEAPGKRKRRQWRKTLGLGFVDIPGKMRVKTCVWHKCRSEGVVSSSLIYTQAVGHEME